MVSDFGSEVVGPVAKITEALRLASDAELDAAILDINVGGAVIFPVADVLQERGIPLIFATGYGARAIPQRFCDSPTLPKPFAYETLAAALRTILANQPCHAEAGA
jgi:DNA-binding response OmpR family regulator